MAFVKLDGSIADLLRDCLETLDTLRDGLSELPEDAPDELECQRCNDEIGRLRLWDAETGARKGQLDYTLRRSSRLRNGVVELLRDLANLSAHGLYCLSCNEFPG